MKMRLSTFRRTVAALVLSLLVLPVARPGQRAESSLTDSDIEISELKVALDKVVGENKQLRDGLIREKTPAKDIVSAVYPNIVYGSASYLSQLTKVNNELRVREVYGCSQFPDGTLSHKTLWLKCCTEHDQKYWAGGTFDERLQADQELRACVKSTGEPAIAEQCQNRHSQICTAWPNSKLPRLG